MRTAYRFMCCYRSTKTRDGYNVRDVIVTGCHGFSQYSHGNVTCCHPAGPDWLQIGSITLKDEEKSILYLPNAWLNDRIIDATQEMLKRQFPHIWSLHLKWQGGTLFRS